LLAHARLCLADLAACVPRSLSSPLGKILALATQVPQAVGLNSRSLRQVFSPFLNLRRSRMLFLLGEPVQGFLDLLLLFEKLLRLLRGPLQALVQTRVLTSPKGTPGIFQLLQCPDSLGGGFLAAPLLAYVQRVLHL